MIRVDLRQDIQELKEFYSCAKCYIQDMTIPILLKTCRHIFCTKCLVIQGKQHCPKCNMVYTMMDVDRGNKFVSSILQSIRKIEQSCQSGEKLEGSGGQFIFELDVVSIDNMLRNMCNTTESCSKDVHLLEIGQETTDSGASSVVKRTSTDLASRETFQKKRKLSDDFALRSQIFPNLSNVSVQSTSTAKLVNKVLDLDSVKLCKDPLKRNPRGEMQLHLACKKGQADIVKQLIETGMDVNCVDWANWTPLHEAVQSGYFHCAQLLLGAGCLVNVPAVNYCTPLHQATEMKHDALCKLLIHYGADLNALDVNGKTPNDNYDCSKYCKDVSEKSKILVFNCNAVKGSPNYKSSKASLLGKFSVVNKLEVMIIDEAKEDALYKSEVMAALLTAVPIVHERDVERLATSTNLAFTQLIPAILQASYKISLTNRLHRLPRLFDGMNFHLPPHINGCIVGSVNFDRKVLQELIEIGGGKLLKRAPSEASVEGVRTRPYHSRSVEALKECAHFTIYDERAPPLLLYRMRELKHVSVQWLLECIWNSRITWIQT